MEKEIWKPVVGYEGLYEVSNLGRVKGLFWLQPPSKNNVRFHYERILKGHINKKGYKSVNLTKNGKKKAYKIHRLVAMAFIPNPQNYPMINHKNEIKSDNRLENIEWCDNGYNQRYGNAQVNKYRKIVQIGENFRKEYSSLTEASRQTGLRIALIWKCANHRLACGKAGDFRWEYA